MTKASVTSQVDTMVLAIRLHLFVVAKTLLLGKLVGLIREVDPLLSFCDQVVRVDVIAVKKWAVVLYVPDELFDAGSLRELRFVHESNGRSLTCEPCDPRVTQVGLLDVPKFSVNRTQKIDKIRFAGGLMEFVVGGCIQCGVLLGIKLRVE